MWAALLCAQCPLYATYRLDACVPACGTSLTGNGAFKSHLHTGHRVVTEYTIRPKTAHFVLGQIFIGSPTP